MEIIQSHKSDALVLVIKGRLDTLSSSSLQKTLEGLINDKQYRILMDFSELAFISSSGLRVLLSTGKQLRTQKGKLVLCAMQDHIREVFDIAGFLPLFTVCTDQEEALRHF